MLTTQGIQVHRNAAHSDDGEEILFIVGSINEPVKAQHQTPIEVVITTKLVRFIFLPNS